MNSLVTLVTCGLLVSSALAAEKPFKFPKKFNPLKHGVKDSYSNFKNDAVLPFSPPIISTYERFDDEKRYPLEAPIPSSYDTFDDVPEDFIQPPNKESGYIGYANGPSQPMLPPPVDSYSSADGEKRDFFIIPAVESEQPAEESSYDTFDARPLEFLQPPASLKDVIDEQYALISRMAKATPSSYSHYTNKENSKDALSPPPMEKKSSYVDSEESPKKLSPEEIIRLKLADIKIPSKKLTLTK